MDPQTPVENLPGIGIFYAKKLKKLEINTLEDLIYHFPFRYDDFSRVATGREAQDGEKISLVGNIWQISNFRTRMGKFLTRATVTDESGPIEVVWFNQPYLTKTLKPGLQISLSGKVTREGNRIKLLSPAYEVVRSQKLPTLNSQLSTLHTGRIVPIYPETEGLSSKWIRTRIAQLLPVYLKTNEDFLPAGIVKNQKMADLNSALSKIHFPKGAKDIDISRKRLAFDEIFLTQLLSILRQREWNETKTAPKFKIDAKLISDFVKNLPFVLTQAQQRTIDELAGDLKETKPANRLLEGDVGSGKTVVAATGALIAHSNGFDTLIAAPTEILTFQHQKTLSQLLTPFGVKVGIWTKSKKTSGDITCGTHALITSYNPKQPVGFVVVDEQHRFGVAQRAKLFMDQESGLTPHLLTMTATPIPRTLALTLYGDLDLSVLDQMPKGRQKISTFVVPNFKRNDAYKFIEKQVQEGRQAFIITPFVEPSESMETVKAATDEFEKLKKIFSSHSGVSTPGVAGDTPGVSIDRSRHTPGVNHGNIMLGLLHGRLSSKAKEQTIDDFKKGKINILVATPVVEVGIDVPNATIMLIESADRFGLAQLHQLRGRVGRGKHKSYCFLFSDSTSEISTKRLKSMEKIHVGFELAEIDLKMRGAGQIFGLKQSGFFNFKIADITDRKTIIAAQQEAKKLIEANPNFSKHPLLKTKLTALTDQYSQPN